MKLARKIVGNMVRGIAGAAVPYRHHCCVCNSRIARFLPYTPSGLWPFRQPAFMAAMEAVGSDIANFSCPRCESHDRERHLFLYLQATGLGARMDGRRILHFAPETHLAELIARCKPELYVQGDLHPVDVETERVDLQDIQYADESFDLVIANHVLEHVDDDIAALREIHRVLREGGHAILQTPYSPVLTRMFQDAGIASAHARRQAYGQDDHVRLYGRDIFERFASVGFTNLSVRHDQVLPKLDAAKYGVNPREPLFLFQKPRGPVKAEQSK